MDILDLLKALKRGWWLLLIGALVGAGLGYGGSYLLPKKYTSQTELFVSLQNAGNVADLQQGNSFSQSRVQSYVKVATTPTVLNPVIQKTGLTETSPADLAKDIKASSDLNTVIITVDVERRDPEEARKIADAVSQELVSTVERLETSGSGKTPIKLSVLTQATTPPGPSSPHRMIIAAAGALLGLLAAAALALIRSQSDTRVRTQEDLKAITSVPVIGTITDDKHNLIVKSDDEQSARAESFRKLRTNLDFATVDSKSSVFVVSSSMPKEGKTTTSINLAAMMARGGDRVLLIEADLRRPRIADYANLPSGAGLTSILTGRARLDQVTQSHFHPNLDILTTGPLPPNPAELLGTEAMQTFLEHARTVYDTIVLDAPPILPVTDAVVLSRIADATILVVGSNKIETQGVKQSLENLRLVNNTPVGIVLTFLPVSAQDKNHYTYSMNYTTEGRVDRSMGSQEMLERD